MIYVWLIFLCELEMCSKVTHMYTHAPAPLSYFWVRNVCILIC